MFRGCHCELIAVIRGCAERDKRSKAYKNLLHVLDFQAFDEMIKVPAIRTLESYSFDNVLWMEWEDGLAYQKAVGRVWEEAWERQVLKRCAYTSWLA